MERRLIDTPALADLLALSTMTLATQDAQGQPHAAPVYFAAGPDLGLYFFSEASSQHSQDTARDPRAAAAIYPEAADWQAIRGLQLRGVVHPLAPGQPWETAWALYAAKFPFVKALKLVVARNTLYVLRPTWLRLVDNRRGFGFKQEWQFSLSGEG